MPARTPAASTYPLLALLALAPTGCTAWNEALRDRVTERAPSVRFGCSQDTSTSAGEHVDSEPTPIAVRGASDAALPVVAELFEWGPMPTPIDVVGPAPNDVLVADTKTLLVRNGFAPTSAEAPAAILVVDIVRLGAVQRPAQGIELRGRTIGRLDVGITLTQAGDARGRWKLSEQREAYAFYFLASDVEQVLDRAYCGVLDDLDVLIRSDDFRSAIERPGR